MAENTGDNTVGSTVPEGVQNTGPTDHRRHLRPPWPKGVSGNPGGRPKSKEIRRLSEKYAIRELKQLLRFGPPSGEYDANARAKLFDTAVKFSGAMTGFQQASLLLAAAKARAEFASEREWLLFVAAANGHVPEPAGDVLAAMPQENTHAKEAEAPAEAEAATPPAEVLTDEPKEQQEP